MVVLLSVLGAIFSLLGNVFIARKMRSGWLIWIVGNVLWIAENIIGECNKPMIAMYLAYLVINLKGFFNWQTDYKEE